MRLKSRVSHAAILIDGTPLTLDVVPDLLERAWLLDLLERSSPSPTPPTPLVVSAGTNEAAASLALAIESLSATSRGLLLADLAYPNEHVWVREPDDDSDLVSRIGLFQVHADLEDAKIHLAAAHATHG